jgi:hypothetical protein
MPRTVFCLCALLVVASVGSLPQPTPVEPPIRVILPAAIDLDQCRFQYLLGGSFGGYGGLGVPDPDLPGYEVAAVHEGAEVKTISAFLGCTGYQVVPVISGPFPEAGHRTFTIALAPLPSVHIAGVVRGWTASETGRYVEIRYSPVWTCQFFRLPDCMLAPWTVASVQIEQDGSFSADLPDFLRDDVIRRFTPPGDVSELMVIIRDPRTGNILFELKPAGSGPRPRRLRVSSSYSREQLFDLEPW